MKSEDPEKYYSDSDDSNIGLLSQVEAGLTGKDVAWYLPTTKLRRSLNLLPNNIFPILTILFAYLKQAHKFLLPSFVSSRLWPDKDSTPRPVRAIAYLDGIRGFAAWSVVNAHLCPCITRNSGATWSHPGYWEWWRFPLFKIMYNGVYAVGLFFVIGGLTCSLSAVSAMGKSPIDGALAMSKASASVFKRPFRLLLPSFAAMILTFTLIRLGVMDNVKSHEEDYQIVLNSWFTVRNWPAREASFWTQLMGLRKNFVDLLQVWSPPGTETFRLVYYPPLWTIKCELRGSLMLFLYHQAIFYMEKRTRLIISAACVFLGYIVHGREVPFFIMGYMLAETLPKKSSDETSRWNSMKPMLWWGLLALSILVGTYPSWEADKTPIHSWLIPLNIFNFIPADRFFMYTAAGMSVLAISRLPPVMKLFSSPLALYFASISFSLYLVHFWVVQTFGTTVFYYAWLWTGNETTLQTYFGFVIAYPVTLFMCVWVADVFTRGVETPLANLCIKLQKMTFKNA